MKNLKLILSLFTLCLFVSACTKDPGSDPTPTSVLTPVSPTNLADAWNKCVATGVVTLNIATTRAEWVAPPELGLQSTGVTFYMLNIDQTAGVLFVGVILSFWPISSWVHL